MSFQDSHVPHDDSNRDDGNPSERMPDPAAPRLADPAQIARIRSDYGRRIRYHRMGEERAREHLETLGLTFAAEGAQLDADAWRALGIIAFEVIECVSFERPADAEAGAWLHITEHHGKPDASGWLAAVAVQRPYWIRKADLPRLQELENRLAGEGAAWTA